MLWLLLGSLLAAAACGDDDKDPCQGVDAGALVGCECSTGSQGMAACEADGELGECECGTAAGSGGGGSGGSGAPNAGSNAPTGQSGSGGSSGSSSPTPDEDGGSEPTPTPMADGGMTEPPPEPVPDDGNELSICESGVDCNRGLDCYGAGGGGGTGFCSPVCMEDADCAELGDAFDCSMTQGLCRQTCDPDADDACPPGMECMEAGFGGQDPTFACNYPANAGEPPAQAFQECMGQDDCGGIGVCVLSFSMMGIGDSGYCSAMCEGDMDCDGLAASTGNIDTTCELIGTFGGGGGGGFQVAVCTLNCEADGAVCPDGMTCQPGVGPLPGTCQF